MKSHSTLQNNKGFTLIEILVVAALFIMLVAGGALMGFDAIGRSTLHSERDLVVLMLTGARARALANVDQSEQGVRITETDVILFEGNSFNSNPSSHRSTSRNSAIIVSIDPVINPIDIIFDRLSGNVISGVGTTTLSQGGQEDDIKINVQGGIEW